MFGSFSKRRLGGGASRLITGCFFGLLGLAAPAASADEVRAFWADAFSVGFKSHAQIDALVSRAVQGNYNTIIAEVVAFHDTGGSGHGAYYNSAIVPKATDISGGIDPLAVLCADAHAAGLQVQAWIVPYRVSSSWPPAGNPLLAAHPEWLMTPLAAMDQPLSAASRVGGYYTLDPGSPGAQEYLVSIAREIVENYAVDGINLDYIRYVQHDAGYPADLDYDGSSLARFQALTGFVGVPPAQGNGAWDDFRRQTITEFVRRLRAEIASVDSPQQPVWLTADLICFGNAPANFQNSDPYNLYQDWKLWQERGYVDAGIIMNYKREHVGSQASWYRNWIDAAVDWSGPRYVVCGQANYLNTKANSVAQLAYGLSSGANGVCNFSYDATADENMNGTPEADWTWYGYVSDHLFTAPAAVPSLPWRDPNLATEGTVWGRVTDGATGQPVDGASVQVGGLPPVQTDGNGYYVVTLAPAAAGGTNYTVTAESDACSPQQETGVLVPPGGIVRQDVVLCPVSAGPGDMNGDGQIDETDLSMLLFCLGGPDNDYAPGHLCVAGDFDMDGDVDAADLAGMQGVYGGP